MCPRHHNKTATFGYVADHFISSSLRMKPDGTPGKEYQSHKAASIRTRACAAHEPTPFSLMATSPVQRGKQETQNHQARSDLTSRNLRWL
eukprot:5915519-Amphidinium_carterae.1